jgi:hypothetical protein
MDEKRLEEEAKKLSQFIISSKLEEFLLRKEDIKEEFQEKFQQLVKLTCEKIIKRGYECETKFPPNNENSVCRFKLAKKNIVHPGIKRKR